MHFRNYYHYKIMCCKLISNNSYNSQGVTYFDSENVQPATSPPKFLCTLTRQGNYLWLQTTKILAASACKVTACRVRRKVLVATCRVICFYCYLCVIWGSCCYLCVICFYCNRIFGGALGLIFRNPAVPQNMMWEYCNVFDQELLLFWNSSKSA